MSQHQVRSGQLPQHKYAINSRLLGDRADLAWSNLGYWRHDTKDYPQACRQLAEQLAQSLNLNSKDSVLDLGCGQGASLVHWNNFYKINNIQAVELQKQCVDKIQKSFPQFIKVYPQSFLNLAQIEFKTRFDVVLCIDAAYHSALNSFLTAVNPVLNSKGRLGFHSLLLSEKFNHLNAWQKFKYRCLLKCADVKLTDLMPEDAFTQCLHQQGFEHVLIQDFSQQVLQGFAHYVGSDEFEQIQSLEQLNTASNYKLDLFKIKMTARLCQKLYNDGLVRYVQISAIKT